MALYANTLDNGFVYDDIFTIANNSLIKSLDNFPLLFNKSAYFSRSGEMSYRPVVTATYFVDHAVYGLKSWGCHLTNVLLHAVNGGLLYLFLFLLLTPRAAGIASPALLVSILFASHPVLTEAVNCISYREDLLSFLFYMATLCLYLILRTKPAIGHHTLATALLYFISCLSYLFALLSKEMAVTLPLVVLCYEWVHQKTSLAPRIFSRYLMGYIAVTLYYLYLRFYLFHNPEEQIQAWSPAERFFTLPWLIMGYLKLSIFPVQLTADYMIKPVTSLLSPFFIWSFIFIVSIFLVSFILRKEKGFFFGTVFFLITLLPVYNIIPISNPLAERYLYLPMAGSAILVGAGINAIEAGRKNILIIFFLLILCIFAFAVVKRNIVWKDGYSLWTDTLGKTPNSGRVHNNLGIAYKNLGRMEDAISEYRKALSLKPDYPEVYNNLCNAYNNLGRMEDAVPECRKALILKPNFPEAHNNLGNAYTYLGRLEDAILEYKAALRLKSDFSDAYFNLGMVYKEKGLTDNAMNAFKNTLRFNPNDTEAMRALESLR